MKKLKVLLSAALAFVFALSFAACTPEEEPPINDHPEPSGPDVIELVRISVDTAKAKTEYFLGEEFTSEGLVVTRVTRNRTQGTMNSNEPVALSDCIVDSSAYKSDTVGTYEIVVSHTYADITKTYDYEVSVVRPIRLSDLIINVENAKTVFDLTDDFSSDGIVVTAVDYNYQAGEAGESYDVTEDVEIDSSAFVKGVEGTYPIVVSYTKDETTIEKTYYVENRAAAGLDIDMGEVEDTYAYTGSGINIDFSGIDVYMANADGVPADAEPITEGLTYEVYYGKELQECSGTSFTATKSGAYNIWVYYKNYTIPGTEITLDLSAFFIIYVVDTLQSITINPGAVTTQQAGADVMSPTWTFTATYSSGATKQLTSSDVEITGLNTRIATSNGVASVTYSELNAFGQQESATTDVNYVVEPAAVIPGETSVYSFNYSELTTALFGDGTPADKTALTSEAFNTESNAFLSVTIASDSDQYRTQGGGCFEIKNGSVSVTFAGTGTLKITVSSTGGSNTSEIGLKDASGNYISATTSATATSAGYYEVTGTTYVELLFDISEAGTYTLVSNLTDRNRGVRIQTIEMVDNH